MDIVPVAVSFDLRAILDSVFRAVTFDFCVCVLSSGIGYSFVVLA